MIMDFHPFTARRAPIVTDAMSTRETSHARDKVNDRDRIDDTARAKASETPRAREETRRARSGEDVEIARDDAHADDARASTHDARRPARRSVRIDSAWIFNCEREFKPQTATPATDERGRARARESWRRAIARTTTPFETRWNRRSRWNRRRQERWMD